MTEDVIERNNKRMGRLVVLLSHAAAILICCAGILWALGTFAGDKDQTALFNRLATLNIYMAVVLMAAVLLFVTLRTWFPEWSREQNFPDIQHPAVCIRRIFIYATLIFTAIEAGDIIYVFDENVSPTNVWKYLTFLWSHHLDMFALSALCSFTFVIFFYPFTHILQLLTNGLKHPIES